MLTKLLWTELGWAGEFGQGQHHVLSTDVLG